MKADLQHSKHLFPLAMRPGPDEVKLHQALFGAKASCPRSVGVAFPADQVFECSHVTHTSLGFCSYDYHSRRSTVSSPLGEVVFLFCYHQSAVHHKPSRRTIEHRSNPARRLPVGVSLPDPSRTGLYKSLRSPPHGLKQWPDSKT